MQKSLYSLILMDDVVREIDVLAREQNTNRSNLINQILAEYVSLVTPERRINDIFNYIDGLLGHGRFDAFIEPHESIMSVKSSLNYKYRPTIKYIVELYRKSGCDAGSIKIVFRTQSSELLLRLEQFFEIWTKMERLYLKDYVSVPIEYSYEGGKFTRTFSMPEGMGDDVTTAQAISDYIKMFDDLVKGYLSGDYSTYIALENRYLSYLNSSVII